MTTSTYEAARRAFWAAQDTFLIASIEEVRRLIPKDFDAAIFEINDTPRLAFSALLDREGRVHDEVDPALFDEIDEVASLTELHTWDDASNWLASLDETDDRFVIAKESPAGLLPTLAELFPGTLEALDRLTTRKES